MGVIYLVSAESAAGKTAICAGIGKYLTGEGRSVGYLKPLSSGENDTDVTFIRSVLGLAEVVKEPDMLKGKDVVLVEGTVGPDAADSISQATYGAAKEMKAKVIAVESYTGQASGYIDSYKGFGNSLAGIIINKVPQSQLKQITEKTKAEFEAAGIAVLGLIPESRSLLSITVGELAQSLNGNILNSSEKTDELVDNYMLGAMVVDSGLDYFNRKTNKAAVIRLDRPDMQLAALETPTRCLVLSGGSASPPYTVLQRAEIKGIPIITTDCSTSDVIDIVEESLIKARFSQAKKVPALAEIIKQNVDLKVFA
ncbi:MAG: DRTGG domain-containing protein [Dehalococcoidia bacterium]